MTRNVINIMVITFFLCPIIVSSITGGSLYEIEHIQVDVTQGETKDIEIIIVNDNNYSITIGEFQVIAMPCYNICPTMEILTDNLTILENSSGIVKARVYSNVNNKVGITNSTVTCYVEGAEYVENGMFDIPINVKWSPSNLLMPLLIIICIIGAIVFIVHKKKLKQKKK